jgi:hypothetical protein
LDAVRKRYLNNCAEFVFISIFEHSCPAATRARFLGAPFSNRKYVPQDLQYGVVDLYLLGECDDIILSPESTIGGVAAGNLGKSSWRISKNPENWLDEKWESQRIVAKAAGSSACSFGWQFVTDASCYNKLHFVPEQLNQKNDMCRTF